MTMCKMNPPLPGPRDLPFPLFPSQRPALYATRDPSASRDCKDSPDCYCKIKLLLVFYLNENNMWVPACKIIRENFPMVPLPHIIPARNHGCLLMPENPSASPQGLTEEWTLKYTLEGGGHLTAAPDKSDSAVAVSFYLLLRLPTSFPPLLSFLVWGLDPGPLY